MSHFFALISKLVIPNWQRLVEQQLEFNAELSLRLKSNRTRDFIERAEFDQTANGVNKENRKTRLKTSKNIAEF